MAKSSSKSPKLQSLYLVRHAIAEESGPDWPDDSVRPVTSKGAARMRQVVRGLRAMGVELDVVLTSPLLRARETADLLGDGLKPRPDVVVVAALAPGGSPQDVIDALEPYPKADAIGLVGHEPTLGQLAAWFIRARAPLVFKKGGVCRIDFDGEPAHGSGQLLWLATPAMLRGVSD